MNNVGVYNLCINKGSTFGPLVFRFRNTQDQTLLDFTGLQARGKIKSAYTSSTLADLTCWIPSNGEIWISLSSDNGLIDNIAPIKMLQIGGWDVRDTPLTKQELKLFNIGLAPYVWDLETYNSASPPKVIRRVTGLVAVTSSVSS